MREMSPTYIRMKQALEWLKRNQGMIQKTVAEMMGITEVTFSRSLSKLAEKFDADFIISFNQSTGNHFNLEWLLYGKGEMLVDDEQKPSEANKDNVSVVSLLEQIKSLTAQNASLVSTINELSKAMSALVEENQRIKAPTAYRAMSVVPSMVAEQAADYPAKKCSNSNN